MFFLGGEAQAKEVDACLASDGQSSCVENHELLKNQSLSPLYMRQVSILQKDDTFVLKNNNSKVEYHVATKKVEVAEKVVADNQPFRPVFQKWIADNSVNNSTDKPEIVELDINSLPQKSNFTVASIKEQNFVNLSSDVGEEKSFIGISRGVVESIPASLPKPMVVAMNDYAPPLPVAHNVSLPDISAPTVVATAPVNSLASLPKPMVVAMNDYAPPLPVAHNVSLPDISAPTVVATAPVNSLASLPKPMVVAMNDYAPPLPVAHNVSLPDISAPAVVAPAPVNSLASLPKPMVVAMNDYTPPLLVAHNVSLPDISTPAVVAPTPVDSLASLPKPMVVAMNEVEAPIASTLVAKNEPNALPEISELTPMNKVVNGDDKKNIPTDILPKVGKDNAELTKDNDSLLNKLKSVVGEYTEQDAGIKNTAVKEVSKTTNPEIPVVPPKEPSQVITTLPKLNIAGAATPVAVETPVSDAKIIQPVNIPLPSADQILPAAAALLPATNAPIKSDKITPTKNTVSAKTVLFSDEKKEGEGNLSPESRAIVESLPHSLEEPVKTKHKNKKIGVSRERESEAFPEGEWQSNEAVGVDIKVKTRKFDTSHELEKAYDAFVNGNTQAAIESYRAVLSADPQNKDALFGVATTYHRVGLLEEARRYYGQLLAIDPYNRDALNNFFVLVGEESPMDALRQMSALEARNPGFAPIPAQMALLYEKMGDLQKAVVTMRRALSYAPENMSYRYNLAILCDHADEKQEAMKIYQELVEAAYRGEELPAPLRSIQERLTFLRSNSK